MLAGQAWIKFTSSWWLTAFQASGQGNLPIKQVGRPPWCAACEQCRSGNGAAEVLFSVRVESIGPMVQ